MACFTWCDCVCERFPVTGSEDKVDEAKDKAENAGEELQRYGLRAKDKVSTSFVVQTSVNHSVQKAVSYDVASSSDSTMIMYLQTRGEAKQSSLQKPDSTSDRTATPLQTSLPLLQVSLAYGLFVKSLRIIFA